MTELLEVFFRYICTEVAGHPANERGDGMSRQVYFSDVFPKYVFKFEREGYFQNVKEYEYWLQVRGTKFAEHFAPVRSISKCGRVLVMERTTPAPAHRLPKQMPVFLTDFKASNYGLLRNKLVCHDYGTALLPTYGLVSRTRPVEWIQE